MSCYRSTEGRCIRPKGRLIEKADVLVLRDDIVDEMEKSMKVADSVSQSHPCMYTYTDPRREPYRYSISVVYESDKDDQAELKFVRTYANSLLQTANNIPNSAAKRILRTVAHDIQDQVISIGICLDCNGLGTTEPARRGAVFIPCVGCNGLGVNHKVR